MATHEIGHWMGMKHTTVQGSVMQTILDKENIPSDWRPQLSDDDILGIRMLYGSGKNMIYTEVIRLFAGIKI